jgi:glycosyltransferase involved in cell wall biosynthesis
MPFAVTLPPDWSIDVNLVRKKFDLEGDYFICSNQFWAHKNHLTVLKALKKMIQSRKGVSVIFTGKPYDNRNPDYYPSLVSWIKDQGLEGSARFIGFIERKEQLTLMKNSLAVIQPSLFEGWSTVVEDAKALGVPILVSDIPVHREQLPDGYPFFFRAEDDNSLAGLMARFPLGITFSYDLDYSESIRAFGANFQRIVSQLR